MSTQTSEEHRWHPAPSAGGLAALLNSLPGLPDLLALGEPNHNHAAFPQRRNDLFRQLVEDFGFRSVALESDMLAGLIVGDHVVSGQGNLDDVLQAGFSHGFGARPANRDLVTWMREQNARRDRNGELRFYGFDAPMDWGAPSPVTSLLALHDFLSEALPDLPVCRETITELCGAETDWTNPAAVKEPAHSVGQRAAARQLRRLSDDLSTLLRTEVPRLATRTGFWEAELHARTAAGLLRYHAVLASTAENRLARMAALRALMMADNLSALLERERGRGPTLVYAHNSHLRPGLATMRLGDRNIQWWSAGALMSHRLGPRYAFLAGGPC
ncbi:erythromycin esterase family protein [Deinococcus navajonensis]|uniref:Erythromycin esterase family protein n=1 Tax=Deinococcus navajonensis TaxID=309884 RepID=A0ABV8XLP1_9DEIO